MARHLGLFVIAFGGDEKRPDRPGETHTAGASGILTVVGDPVTRAKSGRPACQVGGEVVHVIHRCSLVGGHTVHGVMAMSLTIGKQAGYLLSEGDESGVGQKHSQPGSR